MKQLEAFELHDALIRRTTIDYPKNSVVVEVAFYRAEVQHQASPSVASRVTAQIWAR